MKFIKCSHNVQYKSNKSLQRVNGLSTSLKALKVNKKSDIQNGIAQEISLMEHLDMENFKFLKEELLESTRSAACLRIVMALKVK